MGQIIIGCIIGNLLGQLIFELIKWGMNHGEGDDDND